MASRRRKRRGLVRNIIIGVVGVGALGFLAFTLIGMIGRNVAVIETGGVGKQYSAQAIIVRDERLTDAEGLTRVKYAVDEGALVYKGSKIAEVYASGYSQTDMNKLLNMRANIKQQLKSVLASDTYADSQREDHDRKTLELAKEVGLLVQEKEPGNLLNLERQLNGALTRRQTYLKEKYTASDPTLGGYYEQEGTLLKKIQSWTTTYLAEEECIISFYTDGWESVLGADTFNDVQVGDAINLLSGGAPPLSTTQRGRSAVFRSVKPNGWYLLLVSTDPNWTPPAANTRYKVRLSGFDDLVVDAVVVSNQQVSVDQPLLVRATVESSVRPVINLRHTAAVVSEDYVTGLRVPINAIYHQGEHTGVVLTDRGGLFVPVEVINSSHEYVVIRSLVEGALMEGQKIRLF